MVFYNAAGLKNLKAGDFLIFIHDELYRRKT